MIAINRKVGTGSYLRGSSKFQVGDRIETSNHRIGTVVRLDRDELGDFIVAQLDILPGEFAYDYWDLEKIQ